MKTLRCKNSGSFHISALNIDCGYTLEPPLRGGPNEYPQSMFLSKNKKINVYSCKPQFNCIKVGFKGGQNYIGVFSWWDTQEMPQFRSTAFPCYQKKKQWQNKGHVWNH